MLTVEVSENRAECGPEILRNNQPKKEKNLLPNVSGERARNKVRKEGRKEGSSLHGMVQVLNAGGPGSNLMRHHHRVPGTYPA